MQRQTQRFEANFSRIVARLPEDLSSKIKTFSSPQKGEKFHRKLEYMRIHCILYKYIKNICKISKPTVTQKKRNVIELLDY